MTTEHTPNVELTMSETEPMAWLHTMHMEGGQTMTRLLDWDGLDEDEPRRTAFGLPGRDYSEEYHVTSEPLYPRSPTPSTEPELIERIAKAIADAFDADAVDTTNLARAALVAMQEIPDAPTCTVARTPDGILWLYSGEEWRATPPSDKPAEPVGDAELIERLKLLNSWLVAIVEDCDFDEIVADGGVTAGMVVQQEAREQSKRLRAVIAALQATPSNHVEMDHG